MQKEMDESSDEDMDDSEGDSDNEGEEESDGQLNMRFDESTKGKSSFKKTEKGIMGLKFMERAQAKEKEALQSQVNMAVKEIKGQDDYAGSDGEGESSDEGNKKKNIIDSSNKFGVKAMKPSKHTDARETGKELDADKVLKAARIVTGNVESDSSEEDEPMPVIKKEESKKKNTDKAAPTTVEFGDDDL